MTTPPTPPRDLLDHRLIVVTGKGGVGKTAVACALSEAARRAGKRVLLAETAAIESAAALFEQTPRPVGYAGRELRPGLQVMRIDPYDALAEYVRLQFGLGALTDRVLQTRTFQQLLEAAPGWRELITLGKIWHLEQKTDAEGAPVYDLIVVDAPATGHGLTFLDVPRVVQQAVRAGPLARHAGWVEALVQDRDRTLLLPVTLPEELPARETRELVERVRRDLDIGVDRIVVNRMPSGRLGVAQRALERLPEDLALETLPPVDQLRALVGHAAQREALAIEERRRVSELCGLPLVDLPSLPSGIMAGSGWMDEAEAVLATPRWPEQPDSQIDANREGGNAA